MPSSSLVEVKVEFEVEVGFLRCNLDLSLVVVSTFTGGWSGGRMVGWSGGWVVGRLEGNA